MNSLYSKLSILIVIFVGTFLIWRIADKIKEDSELNDAETIH